MILMIKYKDGSSEEKVFVTANDAAKYIKEHHDRIQSVVTIIR